MSNVTTTNPTNTNANTNANTALKPSRFGNGKAFGAGDLDRLSKAQEIFGYTSNKWGTYDELGSKGHHVRYGQHGIKVGDKYFFNLDQTESDKEREQRIKAREERRAFNKAVHAKARELAKQTKQSRKANGTAIAKAVTVKASRKTRKSA